MFFNSSPVTVNLKKLTHKMKASRSNFEVLPEYLIQKILGFFQTQKIIKTNEDITQYEFNQTVIRYRKNLINGSGINTDIKSIIAFSGVCKLFN